MALTDFHHMGVPEHPAIHAASLGAIASAFLHIPVAELAAVPAGIYYAMLAWEKARDWRRGNANATDSGQPPQAH